MIIALVWSVCCLEVRVRMNGQDGDEAYSSVYVRVGECVRRVGLSLANSRDARGLVLHHSNGCDTLVVPMPVVSIVVILINPREQPPEKSMRWDGVRSWFITRGSSSSSSSGRKRKEERGKRAKGSRGRTTIAFTTRTLPGDDSDRSALLRDRELLKQSWTSQHRYGCSMRARPPLPAWHFGASFSKLWASFWYPFPPQHELITHTHLPSWSFRLAAVGPIAYLGRPSSEHGVYGSCVMEEATAAADGSAEAGGWMFRRPDAPARCSQPARGQSADKKQSRRWNYLANTLQDHPDCHPPGIGSSSSFRHNAENAAAQAFDPLNVDPDDSSLETLIPSYGCDEERGTPICKPRCGTCVPPVDTTVDKECPRQPHCSTFDEGMHITNQKAALVPLCLGATLPWPVLGDRRVCSKRC
ncbi:uncharacterized protein K489DRAFT_397530 [Dissoconium aciculare CBS 342.82]|uniref:Uncharacterized protein n=1 Tax=Dissoconium aciculare CBS 342.82 TaxID=1314786 RepID=A0A6J3MHP3_9PEZI|nr:uncharacterized protein K489DRAFT_397530 [Dissoconium aciculare CBS 342.82]KAF1827214.1 hypothetical protein K489DRAFT_397530 [Dissoconium aciculare CBS 342.82]